MGKTKEQEQQEQQEQQRKDREKQEKERQEREKQQRPGQPQQQPKPGQPQQSGYQGQTQGSGSNQFGDAPEVQEPELAGQDPEEALKQNRSAMVKDQEGDETKSGSGLSDKDMEKREREIRKDLEKAAKEGQKNRDDD